MEIMIGKCDEILTQLVIYPSFRFMMIDFVISVFNVERFALAMLSARWGDTSKNHLITSHVARLTEIKIKKSLKQKSMSSSISIIKAVLPAENFINHQTVDSVFNFNLINYFPLFTVLFV